MTAPADASITLSQESRNMTTEQAALLTLIAKELREQEQLLWSIERAAAALNVSRRQFDHYRKREDFPLPVILPPAAGKTSYPRYRPEDIKRWRDLYLVAA